MSRHHENLRKLFQVLEATWLIAMLYAYWHHSPPLRDQWVWLSLGAVPIYAFHVWQAWATRRAWRFPWLTRLALVLLLWTAINYLIAPFHRDDYWVVAVRLQLGISTVIYLTQVLQDLGKPRTILLGGVVTISFVIALLALSASQWNHKSGILSFIIQYLPVLDYRQFLPDARLSFNANEIAGTLAWLCPLMFGMALTPFEHLLGQRSGRMLRLGAGVTGFLLLSALILGQSRFAIVGVLLSLGALVWWHASARRWRVWGMFGVGGLLVLQGILTVSWVNFAPDQAAVQAVPSSVTVQTNVLAQRDENSLSMRLEIWSRALWMMRDYPLSGTGMAMFRTAVSQPNYLIPHYRDNQLVLPHAHNEILHVGAELGIIGLGLFVGIYVSALVSLWRAWRAEDKVWQGLALAVALGLAAHALYGLGDAVTLWDRFSFIWWILLGLATGLGEIARQAKKP